MGVVSNASGQIEAVLARETCQVGEGAHVAMRVIVDSHVVGVTKPDPAIFDHALPHFAEFDPARIAYVGDSVTMDIASSAAPVSIRSSSIRTTITPGPTSSGSPRSPNSPPNSRREEWTRSDPRPSLFGPQGLSERTVRHPAGDPSWRAITRMQRSSSAPSKIDSTRASTNRRLTGNSSA